MSKVLPSPALQEGPLLTHSSIYRLALDKKVDEVGLKERYLDLAMQAFDKAILKLEK